MAYCPSFLISLFSFLFPVSSWLLPCLRKNIIRMIYVITFVPHHLTWRVFPAPDAEISAEYPHSFHKLLITLDAASLPYERVPDALVPACTPSRKLWPFQMPNHSLWLYKVSSNYCDIQQEEKSNYTRFMLSQSPKWHPNRNSKQQVCFFTHLFSP